jgi:hypothetical protein
VAFKEEDEIVKFYPAGVVRRHRTGWMVAFEDGAQWRLEEVNVAIGSELYEFK